jgi:hypothetical protein
MMKVSPNVFTRELSTRYGVAVSGDMVLRRIANGLIPATLNEKGTRWLLDLADIEVAAEALGLIKIPNAA